MKKHTIQLLLGLMLTVTGGLLSVNTFVLNMLVDQVKTLDNRVYEHVQGPAHQTKTKEVKYGLGNCVGTIFRGRKAREALANEMG